jgi:ACS family hexuronate transporter-like MFS transporter
LQRTGSYAPIFFLAGSAYLVALAIIHWLAPRLEPASLDPPAASPRALPPAPPAPLTP